MINKNKKYIAAVSGGPDSMALLDKYHKHIVGVCHVNYHKRVDSNNDQNIVTQYCKKHNIPLAVYEVNKKEYANASVHNFQALARTIRYEFFVSCSKKFKCNNLLIAHNLNDFLETAIMQERRNSNNFFYGIRQNNKYENLNICRPLLNEFKVDLQKYCDDNNILYAIDSSNASDIYERNRIRKELLKLSKKQLLKLKAKFDKRNIKFAKEQKLIEKTFDKWSTENFNIDYFNKLKLSSAQLNSLLFLYLKLNNINRVNHNKIKLVRDFIISKKVNEGLRLETNIYLTKKNKHLKVVSMKKTKVQHEKFMQMAIEEALKGIKAGHGGPFGSVIVKNGKVIAKAHNTVVVDKDPTAHGEINCIRAAAKKLKTFDLKGCVLYTTGYPCPMCMSACQWANIVDIYYGCNLDDTEDIGFRDLKFYKSKLSPTCIAREECLDLYSKYKKMLNKTKY